MGCVCPCVRIAFVCVCDGMCRRKEKEGLKENEREEERVGYLTKQGTFATETEPKRMRGTGAVRKGNQASRQRHLQWIGVECSGVQWSG